MLKFYTFFWGGGGGESIGGGQAPPGVRVILTLALHVLQLQLVTTTSIILSTNNIRNGDILVQANPDPPGKWAY